ncbi:MAG: pyrroline-5-carboxylate reductase [Phycisphaerales bacterium]|nr:pyrroline-5-carboxylate reductase [Phycisphaerales bacterium]
MTSPRNAAAELSHSTWCVIGGGNMASAIVLGALDAGVLVPDQFVVVELDAEKRAAFASRGIAAVEAIGEGIGWIGSRSAEGLHILLAVKPQALPTVTGVVASAVRAALERAVSAPRVVSILAGTPCSKLESLLGTGTRVIRAMPNTPARIRRGTTAITCGKSCRAGDEGPTRALFASLGTVVDLDESLFDAFTAIAGSGPAYVFYLAEALHNAAISQGFTAAQAELVVRSMLSGSADLLSRESTQSASALRAAVTSRGGTTAAATAVFDAAGLMGIVSQAISCATERGRELSK